jgi:hypothetical protein
VLGLLRLVQRENSWCSQPSFPDFELVESILWIHSMANIALKSQSFSLRCPFPSPNLHVAGSKPHHVTINPHPLRRSSNMSEEKLLRCASLRLSTLIIKQFFDPVRYMENPPLYTQVIDRLFKKNATPGMQPKV